MKVVRVGVEEWNIEAPLERLMFMARMLEAVRAAPGKRLVLPVKVRELAIMRADGLKGASFEAITLDEKECEAAFGVVAMLQGRAEQFVMMLPSASLLPLG